MLNYDSDNKYRKLKQFRSIFSLVEKQVQDSTSNNNLLRELKIMPQFFNNKSIDDALRYSKFSFSSNNLFYGKVCDNSIEVVPKNLVWSYCKLSLIIIAPGIFFYLLELFFHFCSIFMIFWNVKSKKLLKPGRTSILNNFWEKS